MNLTCSHCGYGWNYTGNAIQRAYTSCPECYGHVKIPWIGTEQRRLAVLSLALILVGCLVLPGLVMAEDIEPIPTETNPVIDAPLPIIISVRYELLEFSTDFFKSIQQRLGFIPIEKSSYAVVINDDVVAVIPENNKFVGITPTEHCLKFQFGTDRWYECEQQVVSV